MTEFTWGLLAGMAVCAVIGIVGLVICAVIVGRDADERRGDLQAAEGTDERAVCHGAARAGR
jgi:hypothetical protein